MTRTVQMNHKYFLTFSVREGKPRVELMIFRREDLRK